MKRLCKAYTGQAGPTNGVGPLDLYRYASPGFRSFSLSPNVVSYFSITGGTNILVDFNQYGAGTDFGDWGNGMTPAVKEGNNPPQVQDAIGTPGKQADLGRNELVALDIVGYTLIGRSTILSSAHVGNTFTASFATVPGQTYQVQFTSSLAQGHWVDLGSPFVAMDITSSFYGPNATSSHGFYRVLAVPPLNVRPMHAVHKKPAISPPEAPFEIVVGKRGILPRNQ